jgi:hypothetical protein
MLMEALQMLKFSLKQKRFDFMDGWITADSEMEDVADDEPDLLATLTESSIDRVLAAVCRDDEDNNV